MLFGLRVRNDSTLLALIFNRSDSGGHELM